MNILQNCDQITEHLTRRSEISDYAVLVAVTYSCLLRLIKAFLVVGCDSGIPAKRDKKGFRLHVRVVLFKYSRA
jgi:hypothetical protein